MNLNLLYFFVKISFIFTAVLNGDLKLFNQVIDKFKEKFLSEKTYTLIIRLMFCFFIMSRHVVFFFCAYHRHSVNRECTSINIIRFFNIDFQVASQCDQGWSSDD